MKNKIMSIFLTIAIIITTIATMTSTASGFTEQREIIFNNRSINGGNSINGDRMLLMVRNDPAVITFNITTTNNAAVNVGFYLIDTRGHEGVAERIRVNSGLRITRVAHDGIFLVQIRNYANTAIRITMNVAYSVTIATPTARIVHCRTGTHNPTTLRNNFRASTVELDTVFGIRFPPTANVTQTTEMRGHECNPLAPLELCGHPRCICGSACNATGHRRGLYRLLAADRHVAQFTLRYVNHGICHPQASMIGTHGRLYGYGRMPHQDNPQRRDLIVSTTVQNISMTRLIQHEFSHTLGAHTETRYHCSSDDCIMGPDTRLNRWCDTCQTSILRNKHRL